MTLAISTVCFHLFLKQSGGRQLATCVCVFNPREFGCYGAISKVKSSINSLSLSLFFALFLQPEKKVLGVRCVDKREKKESVCVCSKPETQSRISSFGDKEIK